ncbi:MAG: metallophosphoesterase family protein [Phycisphaerae bacterium]|nr:metallophosphoesterase family protein [Phycisphaerae bacterium]
MGISHTTGSIVFFVTLLVIATVAITYAAAWIGRKLTSRPEPKRSTLAKWTRRDVLGLAGGGVACIVWGGFFEPYRLEVTQTRIASPKLRGAKRPIRIVHISDMHCDAKLRNEPRLPGLIESLSPDLIVYTGDSINSLAGLKNFRRCLKQIAKIAPTYVSRGNWDFYFGRTDYFGDTGAIELDGTNKRIELAGTHLWVSGAAVMDNLQPHQAAAFLDQSLAGVPKEDFKLFLYHYPDLVYSLADRGVDLHCAGHTHGGQVAMPFYGALMTVSKHGKKFEAGLYTPAPNTHLYVTRGIGMEGRMLRVRFWCRPEISLIELVGQEAETARTT